MHVYEEQYICMSQVVASAKTSSGLDTRQGILRSLYDSRPKVVFRASLHPAQKSSSGVPMAC